MESVLVKIEAFPMNGVDGVCGGACFLSSSRGSLFLVKLQVSTGNRQLPPEENCPPVRVGVSVKVRASFRAGRQPDNCTGEKLPHG